MTKASAWNTCHQGRPLGADAAQGLRALDSKRRPCHSAGTPAVSSVSWGPGCPVCRVVGPDLERLRAPLQLAPYLP